MNVTINNNFNLNLSFLLFILNYPILKSEYYKTLIFILLIVQLFVLAIDATRSIWYEKQDEAIWGRNEKDTSSDESRRGIRKSFENTMQIPIIYGSLNF